MKKEFKELEEAVMAPREKNRTKTIRKKFLAFKEVFEKPWWRKIFRKESK